MFNLGRAERLSRKMESSSDPYRHSERMKALRRLRGARKALDDVRALNLVPGALIIGACELIDRAIVLQVEEHEQRLRTDWRVNGET